MKSRPRVINFITAVLSFQLGRLYDLNPRKPELSLQKFEHPKIPIFPPLPDHQRTIKYLHNLIKKQGEYFNQNSRRYQKIVSNDWGEHHPKRKWKFTDAPRLFTFADWREWCVQYNLTKPRRYLSTSPGDLEESVIAPETTDYFIYNGTHGDLHEMSSLVDNCYDLVLIGQTLEHLYNPFLAMSELFKKVAPGGYVFTSTPTLNMQHMTPFHFFHYTPMGLAVLMVQAGFEVKETGQFGSFHYEQIVLSQYRWPNYLELEKLGNGSILNSPDNPDQVWTLVRKPL